MIWWGLPFLIVTVIVIPVAIIPSKNDMVKVNPRAASVVAPDMRKAIYRMGPKRNYQIVNGTLYVWQEGKWLRLKTQIDVTPEEEGDDTT